MTEAPRRWRKLGWLAPAVLAALAPKCIFCVLAYAGLGAALGLGGPEFCGAPNDGAGHWAVWLSVAGAAAAVVGCLLYWFCKHRRGQASSF